MRNFLIFESYVGWVEKTQHLYNFIALGCALLNPTYKYNTEPLLKK
jgi:hypothetical protein